MVDDVEGVDAFSPVDPIAERTRAYEKLLTSVDQVKHVRIRQEGVKMLEAVRSSFHRPPEGEVVQLKVVR
jgi:hypothetical protein